MIRIAFFFSLFFMLGIIPAAGQQPQPRKHLRLDDDWKFSFGHARDPEKDFHYSLETVYSKTGGAAGTAIDPSFDDSRWGQVNLPHDWAVSLPFVYDPAFNVMAHGYKPVGGKYPETSIGWYRKHFSIDAKQEGKRFELQFDGIFRDARFWLNGIYLGNNQSGYMGVAYDVTDFLKYGEENVLVVRVDATQYEGWFYEGAGIYRHVWLNEFNQTHIVHNGIFAYAEIVDGKAVVSVETTLANQGDHQTTPILEVYLTDRTGQRVTSAAEQRVTLDVLNEKTITQRMMVLQPRLWDLEDPYLYRIHVDVLSNGVVIDRQEMRFGIRNIEVRPDGLFLNGKHLKLQGVNCHQDHAGVGSALPDYLHYYRIRLLKNMGVNAYRTSHHPPAPELLDACDSLGMLVMDEQRLLNSSPEYLDQFTRLIRRDRSRTSVFMWCIGNEEGWIHTTSTGKRMAITLLKLQKQLDPTRVSTYAADVPNVFEGVNEVVPVRSFNYRQFAVADYHRDHPDQPIIGTEMGSTVTSRGMYELDSIRGYVPDQDITAPWWASTAEAWWTLAAENDFWLGGFVWTGFDYRGEPTPFQWPNINSHFGIMDMCGFPKNLYYYYQSWWTDRDVLHISPHWNWMDKKGEPIDVWVNSNADEIELYLNGNSLGKKTMPRNRHLQWTVRYEPGILEAVATKKGKTWSTRVETTGTPFEVVLTPGKTTLLADGMDVSVVNVSVVDREGREVPNANNLITFRLEGDARIIGVGNGDPSSHEPDQCREGAWQRSLFNGKCQVLIQSGTRSGLIHFEAASPNLWKGQTDIITVNPASAAVITSDDPYRLDEEMSKPRVADEMIGADISFLPQLEAQGIRFSDQGVEKDALEILKDHGFNYVRLRIFHTPSRENGYAPGKGFCDLDHALAMAKRVKAAGLKWLLDFHYSDYWADPGKQYKPAAWEGLTFPELKKALHDYTFQVMKSLQEQGTTPDMVQIGNEINHGVVWPEGSIAHPDSLAQLIRAGTAAVKAVDPSVIMMLHIALGGQPDESEFFIDQMVQRGVHFDVIGQSYYPKWHGTLEDLRDNLSGLTRKYGKDVILVEYSARKKEVHKIVFELPEGKGKGTCIWEPLNTWEALFDREGNSNDYLNWYDDFREQYLEKN